MDERERQRLGGELTKATCDNNVERVRELLMKGADVNWRNDTDWTALHWASIRPNIMKVLLKSSPNINQQDCQGRTALHHACQYGYLLCVKLLLATGQCDTGIVNLAGQTALHKAYGRKDVVQYLHSVDVNKPGLKKRVLKQAVLESDLSFVKYLVTEQGVDVNAPVTRGGDTLLTLVVRQGRLNIIQWLTTKGIVDANGPVTRSGDSLLGVAVREGSVVVINYLVTEHSVDIKGPVTKSGDTPAEVAVHKEKLDVIKYLVTKQGMDINGPITKSGITLIEIAVHKGKLEVIKYLVTEQGVDIKGPVTKSGSTPVEIAVHQGKLDVIKYLVTEQGVDINEKHLLLACEHQQAAVVKYLLTTHHVNPNAEDSLQRTPLSLTKSKDVIKLLIQHGANSKNVYALHRKVLNKVFSKDPVKNPVKLFVIGHAGEGKSTLIEAMEHEPTFWTSVVNVFVAPKEVKGVDQRTAGIIPRVFKSRFFGNVQFFDFAGQEAYYSSHAAVIRSAVDTCPPVFMLVIGLHNDDTTIIHSVSYWLGIISNQCTKMECQAPLIVVGSHVDLVKVNTKVDKIKNTISLAVQKFASFDLVDIVAMDCRYSNSDGMKFLRRLVEASCKSIRTKLSVSLNSHMFLIYLVDSFPDELAVTLQTVKERLEARAQDSSKRDESVHSFIPTTIPHLIEICVQLSDKGHILFLHNQASPKNSFIIVDKTALLAEVNGTMFAPEDFKQHCQLATSTGVVPQSKLAKHFSKFDINMLIRFLSHLELAVPVKDAEVLSLISQSLTETGDLTTTLDDSYLFCPALIRLTVPSKKFTYQSKLSYHFGWTLSCMSTDDFFDARFLHVLILRVALSLGLAPVVDPDIPTLQHQCSVWKNGVHWNTTEGAEVVVEVVDRKHVVILIQGEELSPDLLKLRSQLITKVCKSANDFCPTVSVEQMLLLPTDITYPLTISKETVLFSLKSLAKSIVTQRPFVVSVSGSARLRVSDHEVYANLGENILQLLFNENDPVHTMRISDRFLSAVSSSWSKNPQLVDIICSAITPSANVTPQSVVTAEKMEASLKSWRDGSDGTYKSLRQILDQLSVFAGESPLELAGIPYKDFDEKLLPNAQPTTSQPSHTADMGGAGLTDSGECLNPPTLRDHSNSSGLSVEELMREYDVTDEQLNTKIREEDIFDLAGCFDCVETYLNKLGLTAGQQTQVEELAERRDIQTAMTKALKFWRQPNPLSATYRTLLQILLDLKRGDVAVKICQYVKQEVPKHKTQ